MNPSKHFRRTPWMGDRPLARPLPTQESKYRKSRAYTHASNRMADGRNIYIQLYLNTEYFSSSRISEQEISFVTFRGSIRDPKVKYTQTAVTTDGNNSTETQSMAMTNCLHIYEGVSKRFRTGSLMRELQMVQLSATRYSCITIL
jgi:hypothetical protein